MRFTKMHGLGNDFIVVGGPTNMKSEQVAKYCDRHFGIGADALIVVTPLGDNRLRMEYWNANGSFAEMCGNGLRCVVRYAIDNKLTPPGETIVETGAGSLKAIWNGLDPESIEVQIGKVIIDDSTLNLHGINFYTANVGNPHAITIVDDIETAPVADLGPLVENDNTFPNKSNVEFVQILSPTRIKMRTWERGVGETLACGTAMVASSAVAIKYKGCEYPLEVEVKGGRAKVSLDDTGYSRMIGPAETVFAGEIE